ncbi:MAG TPA: 23S rRNA (uracil(1939)-C(5))-methyltransferase RlmD [Steroidobacteraceae bacterium]|jgi:23S rRNA (uracil1939-C5)-methyltransferase
MRSVAGAQVATAKIDDLSHEGRGVAHHEGKTVFIDDALPGELVEWVLRKRGRTFDEGSITRIIESSPARVTPRCPHFGACGGCALQHLAPDQQIAFKQQQLTEALTRIGHVTPEQILPPLQADPWNYRRRARLSARWVAKKNRVVVGFRERSAPLVADLQHCDVLKPPVDSMLQPLSELLTGLSIRDRVPQVEIAVADHAVALLIRILQPLTAADRELLENFQRDRAVRIYLQPGGNDTVVPLAGEVVPLTYRLSQFDVELHFEPADFVQINSAINELMVARAVELLQPGSDDDVLDLFCGLGNFSLPLARHARHVVGVEGEAGLLERARRNAARNGIGNAEFFTANLMAEDVAQSAWATRKYSRILLDPPRAGAREVLPLIARSGAKRVVYISCHPGTLARDAGILVNEHGFELKAAGAMDMFPHTTHVESIAVFDRR